MNIELKHVRDEIWRCIHMLSVGQTNPAKQALETLCDQIDHDYAPEVATEVFSRAPTPGTKGGPS